MKHFLITLLVLFTCGQAFADTVSTSNANQNAQSQSVAQGSIQFSQEPEHTTQTIRNVGAVAAGAYAGSFSQMNCASTVQGGGAIAGLTLFGGGPKESDICNLEVAAFEIGRQSTITDDLATKQMMTKAAMNIRCRLNTVIHDAIEDAGFACGKNIPADFPRERTQPESTRVATE